MNQRRQITSWGHIDWLQSKAFDSSAQADIGIINLLPRKNQAEHTHYSETQFLYTLEGHGEHIINGKRYPFTAGDYFFLPTGVTHATFNHGDNTLRELMLSVPAHLPQDLQDAPADLFPTEPAPDREFIRSSLLSGIRKLASDTLDHLNIPIIITDDQQAQVYGKQLSESCQGCSVEKCPIRSNIQELHFQNLDACGSIVCPEGLTVLVQPIAVEGSVYFYVKGGLFHEYPNMSKADSQVYDVPGSTVNSMRIFLQDISHFVRSYYRERRIEREILLRDATMAEEQLYSREITEAFEQTRNNALNIQIRNHFLFNSLNSIASLAIRDKSMDTYKAIIDLSELLRGLLRREGTRVPLSEELIFLQRYISLQELRHEGTLSVTWKRCSGAEKVIVPHNFLQPVVENSFVHAFKDSKGEKAISIETKVEDGRAVVVIQDNGCGMDAQTLDQLRASLHSAAPHGLSMVYRKLAGVFGMDFTFDIDSAPGSGTTFRLSFPL